MMKKKEKFAAALMSVFPAAASFEKFSEDTANTASLESFVRFACRHGLIPAKDPGQLEEFIRRHARALDECSPPARLSFEEFLDKKEELLKIGLSLRSLTDRINVLIAESGIDLPKVSNTMLTRLRKEPADTAYKQNVLRSLAFWLGHERPDSGRAWNYETLVKLCNESKPREHFREGVRIGFSLSSRGDVIDHEIVGWLRKTVKSYFEQSSGISLNGRWGKVKSHDITTLYVDIPKEEEADDPASYRLCLKNSLSLAHQIAIRWALSRYCTKNRFLSIGIVAGEYASLDNYLLPILNARLPSDPVIRVSDYVRHCLLINDIRVILCGKPSEMALFNGESLTIWWIVALWSALYFDFIPELLEDRILQNDPASIESLNRLLLFPEEIHSNANGNLEPNAITAFFKFPHNALLGVEIAKTLYFRHRFDEANEILRIVLSINPTDLTARTLRMVILRNLAIEAPSLTVSGNLFRQAEREAVHIQKNCEAQSEDFLCEYAIVYLAKAMVILKYTRKDRGAGQENGDLDALRQTALGSLDEAESLFETAMSVSPSGIRSAYLLDSTRILKAVLGRQEDLFADPGKPVDGPPELVLKPSLELQLQIGYLRKDMPEETRYRFLEKLLIKKFKIHDDSISLRSYRPSTFFCHAVSLWDFSPMRTPSITERVLRILNEALEMARAAEKDALEIYSFTRTYGEMIPASEFIRHMETSIRMVEGYASRPSSERVDPGSSSMLMTLNL